MAAVSVLMSVHNAERYLAAAVESVLSQTFADFEFLIVDDGSTDGSRPMLEGYAARDGRIRLVGQPAAGLTRALNQMIGRSTGALLARMDADDISMPGRFESQVALLARDPGVVAVGCQVEQIDEEGRPLGPWPFRTDDASIRLDLFRNVTPMVHPGVMMRRADVVAVGGYDERYVTAQDRDLWWKLASRGKLANLPEPQLRYRRHAGAITGSRTELQLATARRINLSHMSSLGVLDREEDYDAFMRVSSMVAGRSEWPPGARDLETYARVLGRVRSLLGSEEVSARVREESWRAARGWASRGADRRDWRSWVSSMGRLAPPPVPLRLAVLAAAVVGGRASRRLSGRAGVRSHRAGDAC